MATTEADVAAKLIERLLGDPAFRAEFRRDPASACRSAGLDGLADEMSLGAGKAMMTLDVRESKSSLAGVMMAAAMEGVGVYQFGEHILPHIDDVPGVVGDVLSRVSLPALPGRGALGADAAPAPAPPLAPVEEEAGADGAAGGGGAAAAAAPAPVVPPEAAPPDGKGGDAAEKVVPPELAKAEAAAAKVAAAESPEAERAKEAQENIAEIAEEAKDLPSASALPDSGVAPQPVEEVGPGAGKEPAAPAAAEGVPLAPVAAAAPAAPAVPIVPPEAAAPAAPVVPPEAVPVAPAVEPAPAAAVVEQAAAPSGAVAPREPIDPDQFGGVGQGTGGEPDAEALALLENKNIILDETGIADVKAGRIDPRVVAVLTKLSQEHEIKVSCMCSDHSQFTAGGSVSNHFHGRGLDIAAVDGKIVNSANFDAREIATELQEFDPDMRPDEIGTPWAIGGPGYFTDAAHQDHLHIGFKQEITPDWTPPAEVAAGTAAPAGTPVAAAAAVPGQPVAAAAAAPPAPKPGDSMTFQAVTAEEAAKAAPRKGDSMTFMAVEPQPAAAQAAAAAAPVAPVEAVAAAADLSGVSSTYPGDDASQAEIGAWMAKMAQDRGLPSELPIMASLVESDMKNLNFGHADSVGFFQMRVGIWNQGDYAGYPEKPELQMKWFLDRAETVKEARLAAGKPIDDPGAYGEWVADIELPAEQYRYKYGEKLEEAQGILGDAPAAPAVDPAAPAPVAAVVEQAAAPSGSVAPREPIDPDQFGGVGQGTGGEPDAEALALLENKNIILDETGIADVKAGRIDPRVVAVLTKLSQEHEIKVSCMCSDHSQFTAGGSVSNHFHGRGLDIAAVDGKIVNSANFDAREIATELQEFDPDMRPDEIGTPWAIGGPGYFTDAAHQDHLHIGFKQEITPDWTPPAEVASGTAAPAGTPVAAAAAVPGQPVAAAAAAAPAPKPGDSMTFQAVTAEEAAKAAPRKGDSMTFMAVEPQPAAAQAAAAAPAPAGPASALAAPGAVPAAVTDAAAATAAGGSPLGASALQVAQGELGVREVGSNTGADVEKYLAAAGVPPGSPWCASFVTWALDQSGHKMEGGGWAAVQTWVRNAEQGNNNLQIVSAEDARPGDLVAYDWGGQEDFAADGHIGFLASNVEGGKFTALEGNWQDAVLKVPREVGSGGTNMKFIRVNGGEPPPSALGGAPAVPVAAPPAVPLAAAPAVPVAAAPGVVDPAAAAAAVPAAAADPAAAAAAAPPAAEPAAATTPGAAEAREHESMQFMAVKAQEAAKHHATVQFMKAIDPEEAQASAAAAPAAGAPVLPPEMAAGTPAAPSAAADASMVQAVGAPVPANELAVMDVGPIGTYPGDSASQAELAKWLGDEAERAGLPRELPVMASLVESGIKNVKGGDADSAGFFQMRVGIWDQGPYQGYRQDPRLQAKWFIDQALAIKRKRIAEGNVDFGKDPSRWGEWIADVERPAAQYRYKYQTRLAEARGLAR